MINGMGRRAGAISGVSVTSGQQRTSGIGGEYEELMAAIIRQAVKDYERVLLRLFTCPAGKKKMELEMEKIELEVFFHSDWYAALTDIDGDRLVEATRRHAVEKAKESIKRKHKKKLKEMGQAGTDRSVHP